MSKIWRWVVSSILMVSGACLITGWKPVVGVLMIYYGGKLVSSVLYTDKHWME